MTRVGIGRFAIALALCSLSALGCADQNKKQLTELQSQYNDLSSQNKDLQAELAQSKARESELLAELDAKDMELARTGEELAQWQKRLGDASAAPTAQGWEKGIAGDKISVGTDILFQAGKATLTDAGKKALDKIVSDLKGSYDALPVRVYGHTDSDPIRKSKNLWQDNLDLSANRAMAVSRYLASQGVKAANMETIAMGESHPVAPNTTPAGKQKNRRVEIVVVK